MKRKRIYALSAVCTLLSLTATADTLNYLTVKDNGDKTAFTVTALEKITFTGDQMVVTANEGTRNFPLDTFDFMRFTQNQPGDANSDNTVSSTDLTTMAQAVLTTTTDDLDTIAADMDDNGTITVTDITKVAQRILEQKE
jgi:hypothetical protein